MSHRALLMQRINESIEAGAYLGKGSPRITEGAPDAVEDKPAPMPRPDPTARLEPTTEQRRGEPDPARFVEGLAARRRTAVGDGVQSALDERFKRPR